jgi:hypothetical protein
MAWTSHSSAKKPTAAMSTRYRLNLDPLVAALDCRACSVAATIDCVQAIALKAAGLME